MKNITLSHVPKPAPEKSRPKATDRIEKFQRFYSKQTQHTDFLKCMGIKEADQEAFFDYNNTRICNDHKMIKRAVVKVGYNAQM